MADPKTRPLSIAENRERNAVMQEIYTTMTEWAVQHNQCPEEAIKITAEHFRKVAADLGKRSAATKANAADGNTQNAAIPDQDAIENSVRNTASSSSSANLSARDPARANTLAKRLEARRRQDLVAEREWNRIQQDPEERKKLNAEYREYLKQTRAAVRQTQNPKS